MAEVVNIELLVQACTVDLSRSRGFVCEEKKGSEAFEAPNFLDAASL
jgi:hypothetical protein